MKLTVKIGSSGPTIQLTDKDYKAAGGEGSIYAKGGKAYKIYHDHKKHLPLDKIKELRQIQSKLVVTPESMLYDAATGDPLGYVTAYVADAEPLLKLFTRIFKQENAIDYAMIQRLVTRMQATVEYVHHAQCLVVDLNELNVLVTLDDMTPWFIDTDAYATPSYKATAIMDSVRDRRVSQKVKGVLHYHPDRESDWFSWGILAFWLYTNIHPFRGNHPKYKPRDKGQQMDDGISVFHKGVRVPPTVNNFNIIPLRHLNWFIDTFRDNHRSVPPHPDSSAPTAVPAQAVLLQSTATLEIEQVFAYPDPITRVFEVTDSLYVVTAKAVFHNQKELFRLGMQKKIGLTRGLDGSLIMGKIHGSRITFTEALTGVEIDSTHGTDLFVRNNCFYTVNVNKLVEHAFQRLNRLVCRSNSIDNVSEFTATVYDGCVIQDLLGRKYLTVPYARGSSNSMYLPALDGFRVVAAKSEKNITVILAEQGGKYSRFIVFAAHDYQTHTVRIVADVAYEPINFTVTASGFCVLLANQAELEMFALPNPITTIADPPLDATMPLFSLENNSIFFVSGNTIHRLRRR